MQGSISKESKQKSKTKCSLFLLLLAVNIALLLNELLRCFFFLLLRLFDLLVDLLLPIRHQHLSKLLLLLLQITLDLVVFGLLVGLGHDLLLDLFGCLWWYHGFRCASVFLAGAFLGLRGLSSIVIIWIVRELLRCAFFVWAWVYVALWFRLLGGSHLLVFFALFLVTAWVALVSRGHGSTCDAWLDASQRVYLSLPIWQISFSLVVNEWWQVGWSGLLKQSDKQLALIRWLNLRFRVGMAWLGAGTGYWCCQRCTAAARTLLTCRGPRRVGPCRRAWLASWPLQPLFHRRVGPSVG